MHGHIMYEHSKILSNDCYPLQYTVYLLTFTSELFEIQFLVEECHKSMMDFVKLLDIIETLMH